MLLIYDFNACVRCAVFRVCVCVWRMLVAKNERTEIPMEAMRRGPTRKRNGNDEEPPVCRRISHMATYTQTLSPRMKQTCIVMRYKNKFCFCTQECI